MITPNRNKVTNLFTGLIQTVHPIELMYNDDYQPTEITTAFLMVGELNAILGESLKRIKLDDIETLRRLARSWAFDLFVELAKDWIDTGTAD